QINSAPVGAEIFLNGTTKGLTNQNLSSLETGTYNVTVVKAGYDTAVNETVSVTKGVTTPVSFALVRQTGHLQINSTPSNAEIFLNGTSYGFTNSSVPSLNTGVYNVTVMLDGYNTAINETVMVTNATTQLVNFILTPVNVAPITNFTATPLVGYAPLAVNFTDISTGSPTEWLWNFGDGQNATVQHPVHIYQHAGTYAVSLKATNVHGNMTAEKTGFIDVRYYSGGSDSGDGYTPRPAVVPTATPVTVQPTAEPTVTNPDEFTETAQLPMDTDGAVQQTVTLWADDRSGYLTVDAGVVARDALGLPQGTISIVAVPITSLPAPSPGEIGSIEYPGMLYAFDCSPDGMTFSPAISLTFVLSEEEWEKYGEKAEVGWFNSATGVWEAVTGVADADTRTITIQIDHFSTYALFGELLPQVPMPDVTNVPGKASGASSIWLFGGLILVIALGVAGYVVISKRQKK
ncbi:MAG: PEGA domain-containing protein, partial [Methanogenium sp.]